MENGYPFCTKFRNFHNFYFGRGTAVTERPEEIIRYAEENKYLPTYAQTERLLIKPGLKN
jgi:hypothetical protein